MENFLLFFQIGLQHILEGYDHLLFLAGLIIVTKNYRELFSIISAFTIAHSTTLILSALGILSLNPLLTETLIAASIAYVGIENIIAKQHRFRWIIAGGFGLVHGAGFSGHLTELLKTMLGMGNIWAPLTGFNIGIEAGQMIVVSASLPILWLLKNKGKQEVVIPKISMAIAAAGIFLMITRLL